MNKLAMILPAMVVMLLPATQVHADDVELLHMAQEAETLCKVQAPAAVDACLGKALTEEERQLLQTHTDASNRQRAATDAYLVDIAYKLLHTETPRATLLAARLLRSRLDDQDRDSRKDESAQKLRADITEMVRAAALRAGDDPIVLWSLASGRYRDVAPDLVTDAVARLRELHPENLAVWMLGDSSSPWTAEHLSRAAVATHFDLNYYGRLRADVELLRSFPVPQELKTDGVSKLEMSDRSYHASIGMGYLMAEAIPSLSGISEACAPGRAGWEEANRAYCEHIAQVMFTRSDTLIGVYLGNGMQQRLVTSEAERDAAKQARRSIEYQVEIGSPSRNFPEDIDAMFDEMLAPGASEMGVLRAAVKASGLPETPPREWRSARERESGNPATQ